MVKTQYSKNKYRRTLKLPDPNTGEIRHVVEMERVTEDLFYKVFRTERYRMYPKGLSGATHEIIQYLVIEMRKDNIVFYDNEEIAQHLELSVPTVKKVKAILLDKDIMRPKHSAYMFSPYYNCTVKGSERSELMADYLELKQREPRPATQPEGEDV